MYQAVPAATAASAARVAGSERKFTRALSAMVASRSAALKRSDNPRPLVLVAKHD